MIYDINAIAANRADTLYGSEGVNEIDGRGGEDLIRARGGDDKVVGGTEADRIYGGAGRDVLVGKSQSSQYGGYVAVNDCEWRAA